MRVGAVIILYHPDLEQVNALINSVSKYVDAISIIDNSKTPANISLSASSFHHHHFEKNVGIAAAQNIGLEDLLNDGCDFALLLDQDSVLPNNLVQTLSAILTQRSDLIAIGPRIVCSFTQNELRPKIQREIQSTANISYATQIISSGMMICLSKIASVGLKEEGLFIDGVDHEWCWRAKEKQHEVAIANNVKMLHTIGEHRNSFMGVSYRVGTPIRLYYQFRNIFVLSRRQYVPTYWKFRNIGVLPFRAFLNIAKERNRRERAKYMWLGFWDGILNRQGAYHNWH